MHESPKTTDKTSLDSDSAVQRIRIATGSRLHFGLLDTAAPFGGVGVMIEDPKTEVLSCPSERFECSGPDASRIESIASRIAEACHASQLPRCKVEILSRPTSHCGLGSGTQLSLAVAEAMVRVVGEPVDPERIACRFAGRGQRSAVGSHGYFRGGLIYEEASGSSTLNPIHARVELPEDWRVAILRPTHPLAFVSGDVEAEQFGKLPAVSLQKRDELRGIITDSMIPAARDALFDEFADSVHRYNRASGELFAEVQGGPYHGPQVTELVKWMVDQGAAGVGQSSWGPGVFAWFESEYQWREFRQRLPEEICCVAVTTVRNQGRSVQSDSEV